MEPPAHSPLLKHFLWCGGDNVMLLLPPRLLPHSRRSDTGGHEVGVTVHGSVLDCERLSRAFNKSILQSISNRLMPHPPTLGLADETRYFIQSRHDKSNARRASWTCPFLVNVEHMNSFRSHCESVVFKKSTSRIFPLRSTNTLSAFRLPCRRWYNAWKRMINLGNCCPMSLCSGLMCSQIPFSR